MKRSAAPLVTLLLVVFTGAAEARGQCDEMLSRSPNCWSGPSVSAALYVRQWQGPAGYSIRIYIPGRRTGDILVSVRDTSLLIRSDSEQRLGSGKTTEPAFVQFGRFRQWLTLPADADTSRMKLASRGEVIGIFVPRRP